MSLNPEGRLAHWSVPVYTGSRWERVPEVVSPSSDLVIVVVLYLVIGFIP